MSPSTHEGSLGRLATVNEIWSFLQDAMEIKAPTPRKPRRSNIDRVATRPSSTTGSPGGVLPLLRCLLKGLCKQGVRVQKRASPVFGTFSPARSACYGVPPDVTNGCDAPLIHVPLDQCRRLQQLLDYLRLPADQHLTVDKKIVDRKVRRIREVDQTSTGAWRRPPLERRQTVTHFADLSFARRCLEQPPSRGAPLLPWSSPGNAGEARGTP